MDNEMVARTLRKIVGEILKTEKRAAMRPLLGIKTIKQLAQLPEMPREFVIEKDDIEYLFENSGGSAETMMGYLSKGKECWFEWECFQGDTRQVKAELGFYRVKLIWKPRKFELIPWKVETT